MKHNLISPFLLLACLLATASRCSETEIDGGGQPEGAKTGLAAWQQPMKGAGRFSLSWRT